MRKKKTTEEFIEEAKLVHGDKYGYDKTVYEGAKSNVLIYCYDCNDYFEQRATNHTQGRGCDNCGGSSYKTDEELLEIMNKHNLENKNYKIISIYRIEENGYNKIKCDCECIIDGHKWSIPLTALIRTEKCPKCNNCIQTYTIDMIKDIVKSKHSNIEVLSDEYITSKSDLICYCKTHNTTFPKSFDEIIHQKYPCHVCHYISFTGENNPYWNPNLTLEDRENGRKIKCEKTGIKIEDWRNEVFANYGYTCAISGQVGCKLNAHHLDGWHWCKERRFDITNGVCLSNEVHREFHKKYGIKNNTLEQFKEFYFNKTGEEFIPKGENERCN